MYTNVHRCFFNCTLSVHSFLFVFLHFLLFLHPIFKQQKILGQCKITRI